MDDVLGWRSDDGVFCGKTVLCWEGRLLMLKSPLSVKGALQERSRMRKLGVLEVVRETCTFVAKRAGEVWENNGCGD